MTPVACLLLLFKVLFRGSKGPTMVSELSGLWCLLTLIVEVSYCILFDDLMGVC